MSDTITDLIHLTDGRGKTIPDVDLDEPLPGSIVMHHGEYGTAWQRYFSDGMWHRVGGGACKDWEWLLTKRNLVLVYDAPVRSQS